MHWNTFCTVKGEGITGIHFYVSVYCTETYKESLLYTILKFEVNKPFYRRVFSQSETVER